MPSLSLSPSPSPSLSPSPSPSPSPSLSPSLSPSPAPLHSPLVLDDQAFASLADQTLSVNASLLSLSGLAGQVQSKDSVIAQAKSYFREPYPVGSYYTQYPRPGSSLLESLRPEDYPENLFGGSWIRCFQDKSYMFRSVDRRSFFSFLESSRLFSTGFVSNVASSDSSDSSDHTLFSNTVSSISVLDADKLEGLANFLDAYSQVWKTVFTALQAFMVGSADTVAVWLAASIAVDAVWLAALLVCYNGILISLAVSHVALTATVLSFSVANTIGIASPQGVAGAIFLSTGILSTEFGGALGVQPSSLGSVPPAFNAISSYTTLAEFLLSALATEELFVSVAALLVGIASDFVNFVKSVNISFSRFSPTQIWEDFVSVLKDMVSAGRKNSLESWVIGLNTGNTLAGNQRNESANKPCIVWKRVL